MEASTKPEPSIDEATADPVPALRRCSIGQRRFWVLDRLDPGNPALNVAVRWRLEGELSTEHLEQAFRLVLRRHEVLRCGFVEQDGDVVAEVQASVPFRIAEIDLRGIPEADVPAEIERISLREAGTGFDLQMPPLLRVVRPMLRADTSILLVTMHHIVCDGWSVGILAREVGLICDALQAGTFAQLPELPLSYADFADWQNASLASAPLDEPTAYWQRQLAGMRQFELLTDRPRPPVMTAHGRIQSRLLRRELGERLIALGKEQGCTPFMTALSGLLVLLHRHSGETDIAIGTQVATRTEIELEPLIGLFVNTLVLRQDVSGDPGFVELLQRVRDTVSDAFEHRQLPLERVIEMLRPARDRSRNALFSINFVLQRSFIDNAVYRHFRLIDMPSVSAGPMHDLNFFMVERPEGWRLSCDYNTDLFDDASVARMLAQLERLFEAACRDPAQPISKLPLLDRGERDELLVEWNRTEAAFPRHRSVVELLDAQVERTPDADAVCCAGVRLSYRELDQASTRMAHALRAQGIGAGARVGIFLERSVELVVAILAVLKTGGAYVPLDLGNPLERLRQIVGNAALAAVLTREHLQPRLPADAVTLLPVERLDLQQPATPLPPVAGDDDLAYIIHTSGSSGQPKGVMVGQQALLNLLHAVADRPHVGAADCFVSVSTVAFDISGLELFSPLVRGARLVIATDAEVADGVALLQLLQRERATVMFATPVTWQLLLAAGWNGQPRLKVMCGGEAVPRELIEKLLAAGNEFWHVYGPTETTIYASARRLESVQGTPLLGGPLPNLRFYVLDPHLEPVPVGVPGELYIGGAQVAFGYAGQPQLTAERFVADPFSDRPGARMYRSGDLVRWRARDAMEFLGRNDGQVKLRGFRIELGEITSALLACADVAEAHTIIGRDASGEPALWSYVSPRPGFRGEAAALAAIARAEAMRRLPAYMCPSAVVALASLPRTLNGKVDVRALPPPPVSVVAALQAPVGETESRIAAIWREILGRSAIGRDQNFFELGGHSLLAARMLARVEREFGQRLSLSTLFNAPTVEQLAAVLGRRAARNYDFRQRVSLRSSGGNVPLIALNNTGIYFLLSRRLGAEQPFSSLQLFDPAAPSSVLPRSFADIAAGYVELIREQQPRGPYRLLGWCIAGTLAFEVACQLRRLDESVTQLIIIDGYAPDYPARLPWYRRVLAQWSHRLQLITLDVADLLSRRQSLRAFFDNRGMVKRWRQSRAHAAGAAASGALCELSAERYDQWLLQHLQAAVSGYTPGRFDGSIELLRSRRQPGGRFLDEAMGWRTHAADVRVTRIDGDHFSIFEDPGALQMAQAIGRPAGTTDDAPVNARGPAAHAPC